MPTYNRVLLKHSREWFPGAYEKGFDSNKENALSSAINGYEIGSSIES